MKKVLKLIFIFIVGLSVGYYTCYTNSINVFFTEYYKAFQVGVYTNLDAAYVYSSKYNDSIIIEDNELYRVYVAILKEENNIENMSKYLQSQGIDYYLKDVKVEKNDVKKEMQNYESLMSSESELVFLELNKMIMETYKESL